MSIEKENRKIEKKKVQSKKIAKQIAGKVMVVVLAGLMLLSVSATTIVYLF